MMNAIHESDRASSRASPEAGSPAAKEFAGLPRRLSVGRRTGMFRIRMVCLELLDSYRPTSPLSHQQLLAKRP